MSNKQFNNQGVAVIQVKGDDWVAMYDLGNCQDIFGRCEGEQVSFEKIERIFDEVWQRGQAITSNELFKMMYAEDKLYLVEEIYVGPNTEQNVDANTIRITTEPARNNLDGEVRTSGWCGTTNDWATYAHGEFTSLDDARAAAQALRPDGLREFGYEHNDGTVVAYRPGRYDILNATSTVDYLWDSMTDRVNKDMTESEAEILAAEFEADAEADNVTLTDAYQAIIDYRDGLV